MTKKKHEELVGEITEALGGICDPMASYHPSKEEYLRDVARTFITLILSAVRDGGLDEELGVVGRWNLTDIYEPTGKWLQSWLKEMMFDKDMHTLIALRPLSGTGKEE